MRSGRIVLAGLAVLALAGCVSAPEVSGRADFRDYCAACHGPGGQGGGPGAAALAVAPPDLTRIAARNGGVFPRTRVMSVIDGYTRRDQHGSLMPEMGPLIEEGDLVLVPGASGAMTPTPARLVALADYLEALQQP